jgi:hypothetical protein
MDDPELDVVSLASAINLNHIQKGKLLESPLEVTVTDSMRLGFPNAR